MLGEIADIKKISSNSKRYDICVDKNHNFFANDILVHNCSWYSDHIHARSVDSVNHPSRNFVKSMWAKIAYEIPEGWRICGENLYAQHSIPYTDLDSYFLGFSIWNEKNECLNWDETLMWFELFGIKHVPILYDGIWDEDKIKSLYNPKTDWEIHEGYVVRTADSFSYKDFKKSVAKYVREKHVMTAKHWMHGQAVVPNMLKQDKGETSGN